MAEENYGGQATFNQAQFQMIRLNDIMKEVNMCWTNLSGNTFGVPNYQILFDNLCAYLGEAEPNFTPKEAEECKEMLIDLETEILTKPLWITQRSGSLGGSRIIQTINAKQYAELRSKLRQFQSKILKYAHAHGLGNPSKSDPSKAVLN